MAERIGRVGWVPEARFDPDPNIDALWEWLNTTERDEAPFPVDALVAHLDSLKAASAPPPNQQEAARLREALEEIAEIEAADNMGPGEWAIANGVSETARAALAPTPDDAPETRGHTEQEYLAVSCPVCGRKRLQYDPRDRSYECEKCGADRDAVYDAEPLTPDDGGDSPSPIGPTNPDETAPNPLTKPIGGPEAATPRTPAPDQHPTEGEQ